MKTTKKWSLKFSSTAEAVNFLKQKLATDSDFKELLEESLNKANEAAKAHMNPDLYAALAWPTNSLEYIAYLIEYDRWIPQQSPLPAWQNPENGNAQEVYDRLCHYYFLVDQPVGVDGTVLVQDIDWFSDFLIGWAQVWGDFLDTPESFNDDILNSFINYSPKFRVQDSMINGKPNKPGGWLTWNEFFARELNPGLRPIANPSENGTVVSPADCTYRMHYPIAADSTIPEITMKKTHKAASIQELLSGSKYANSFGGGTYIHYFLGPYSYHRFHTPVSGVVEECYAVHGQTFLEVNLKAPAGGPTDTNMQFDAPDDETNGYEFTQARGILTIDTTNSPHGDMGIIAVIPVGMCQVSAVEMTLAPGTYNKGEEFGYFKFGGSDIIVLFQEGKAPNLNTCSNYRHYGTDLSVCPPIDLIPSKEY